MSLAGPAGTGSHTPLVPQMVEQQMSLPPHAWPVARQRRAPHWPLSQLSVQHSRLEAHGAPGASQNVAEVHRPSDEHTPEQHEVVSREQVAPTAEQMEPGPESEVPALDASVGRRPSASSEHLHAA